MIRSVRFLGVQTAAFDATVALYRDVLRVEPVLERRGNVYEIIGPDRSAS